MSEIISRATADKLQAGLSRKNEEAAAIGAAKECFESMAETRDELVARVAVAITIQRKLAKVSAFQEILGLKQPLVFGPLVQAAGYWLRCWIRRRIETLNAEVASL